MAERKLFICGPKGSGKTDFARLSGLKFESSSMVCIGEFIFDALKPKYPNQNYYLNPKHLYENREKHRKEMFDLIADYNRDDKSRLSKLIFSRSNVYDGCRNPEEMHAYMQHDPHAASIWIDRPGAAESSDSNLMEARHCDIIVQNHGSRLELGLRAQRIVGLLFDRDFMPKP